MLVKPVSSACNLNCAYCFYKDVADSRSTYDYGRMSLETLEMVVRQVFTFAESSACISFQGGEPTLVGLDFFQHYMELLKKYNIGHIPVLSCIQTNGILLDEKWAAFLKKNNFLVGISLDGIEKVHNRYRQTPSGSGTFEQVMHSIHLLQRYEVDFNVLQVITKEAAESARENYRFFQCEHIGYVQPIPLLLPLQRNARECGDFPFLTPTVYANYLRTTFDLWKRNLHDSTAPRIVYFENLITKLMGERSMVCGMSGQCTMQFVVEGDGSVYPCDYFVLDEYILGNVHQQSFLQMLCSPAANRFVSTSLEHAKKCRSCRWYAFCSGGCLRHWQMAETPFQSNYYCAAYKNFFGNAEHDLVRIAEEVKGGHLA